MVEQMTPHAVRALMEGQTPYALIDVREEEEYSAQQIFSATLVPSSLRRCR